jgi:hypothetical protein
MIRWIDENGRNNIETVKFFDLDETERVNVTRPPGAGGFGDLKRFDMRHEAEFMLMARRSANTMDVSDDYLSRAESRGAWRLIPCDGDSNLIEFGKDSKERLIQEDRMRTTLETFYTRNQIPDTPQEPDTEVYLETEISKVIPLEDDNNPNNIHDFSNIDLPQPKTGEQLPSRIPDFIAAQPPINNFGRMPSPQYTSGGPPMGGPNFAGQSMIPPFSAQPLLPPPDQFGVRMPSGPPPQQFFAPNNGPPFQQWGDGGSGPGPGGPPMPHGPQFAPPFPGGRGMGSRPPRLPRNAQNTVCRHYARTGKCRFQPKCNFLHSNESNR